MPVDRRLVTIGLSAAFCLAAWGGAAATPPGGSQATQAPAGTAAASATGAAATANAGGATGDACALLTADDIKKATGFSPISQAGGAQLGIFNVGCEWELDNKDAVPWSIVVGMIQRGGRD